MELLIWIACPFVASVILNELKSNGIKPGPLPIFVLYLIAAFVSYKLCQKWKEYKSRPIYKKDVHPEEENEQQP